MRIQNTSVRDSSTHGKSPELPPIPWPAPPGAPVLLFGGSFDPPHAAHTKLALAARDAIFGDEGWLIYVPAGQNPHKPSRPSVSDEHRIEMLRLAIRGDERSAVWTDEIVRTADSAKENEPSFWVDTLARALCIIEEGTPLRFLIGADQALAFTRWHEHDRILELVEPAVILRDPCPNRESFRRQLLESGLDPAEWMPRLVEVGLNPAASTDIRKTLRRGHSPADELDQQVLEYIKEHDLYSNSSE